MSLPLHRDRSFVLSGCYTPTYSPRRSSPEHPRALAVGRRGGGEQGEGEEAGHSSESPHRPVPPPRESGYGWLFILVREVGASDPNSTLGTFTHRTGLPYCKIGNTHCHR